MPGSRTSLAWGVLAAVSWLGCYRHVPTTLDHVPDGAWVQVVAVAEGRGEATHDRGPRVMNIRGTLLQRDSLAAVFAVPVNRSRTSLAYEPVNQRITVAAGDVLRVDLRRLDVKRTGGLIALLAGAALIATVTGSRVGGSVDQPAPQGDDSIRGILHRSRSP